MNTTNINEKATGFENVLPRLEIDDEKRKFINWVNYYYEHNASEEVLSVFFDKALSVAQGLIPRFMINSKRYDLSLKLHNEFIRNHDDNSIYSTARIMLDEVYFQIDKLWNIQGLNYWETCRR